jgi:hypothetical protein
MLKIKRIQILSVLFSALLVWSGVSSVFSAGGQNIAVSATEHIMSGVGPTVPVNPFVVLGVYPWLHSPNQVIGNSRSFNTAKNEFITTGQISDSNTEVSRNYYANAAIFIDMVGGMPVENVASVMGVDVVSGAFTRSDLVWNEARNRYDGGEVNWHEVYIKYFDVKSWFLNRASAQNGNIFDKWLYKMSNTTGLSERVYEINGTNLVNAANDGWYKDILSKENAQNEILNAYEQTLIRVRGVEVANQVMPELRAISQQQQRQQNTSVFDNNPGVSFVVEIFIGERESSSGALNLWSVSDINELAKLTYENYYTGDSALVSVDASDGVYRDLGNYMREASFLDSYGVIRGGSYAIRDQYNNNVKVLKSDDHPPADALIKRVTAVISAMRVAAHPLLVAKVPKADEEFYTSQPGVVKDVAYSNALYDADQFIVVKDSTDSLRYDFGGWMYFDAFFLEGTASKVILDTTIIYSAGGAVEYFDTYPPNPEIPRSGKWKNTEDVRDPITHEITQKAKSGVELYWEDSPGYHKTIAEYEKTRGSNLYKLDTLQYKIVKTEDVPNSSVREKTYTVLKDFGPIMSGGERIEELFDELREYIVDELDEEGDVKVQKTPTYKISVIINYSREGLYYPGPLVDGGVIIEEWFLNKKWPSLQDLGSTQNPPTSYTHVPTRWTPVYRGDPPELVTKHGPYADIKAESKYYPTVDRRLDGDYVPKVPEVFEFLPTRSVPVPTSVNVTGTILTMENGWSGDNRMRSDKAPDTAFFVSKERRLKDDSISAGYNLAEWLNGAEYNIGAGGVYADIKEYTQSLLPYNDIINNFKFTQTNPFHTQLSENERVKFSSANVTSGADNLGDDIYQDSTATTSFDDVFYQGSVRFDRYNTGVYVNYKVQQGYGAYVEGNINKPEAVNHKWFTTQFEKLMSIYPQVEMKYVVRDDSYKANVTVQDAYVVGDQKREIAPLALFSLTFNGAVKPQVSSSNIATDRRAQTLSSKYAGKPVFYSGGNLNIGVDLKNVFTAKTYVVDFADIPTSSTTVDGKTYDLTAAGRGTEYQTDLDTIWSAKSDTDTWDALRDAHDAYIKNLYITPYARVEYGEFANAAGAENAFRYAANPAFKTWDIRGSYENSTVKREGNPKVETYRLTVRNGKVVWDASNLYMSGTDMAGIKAEEPIANKYADFGGTDGLAQSSKAKDTIPLKDRLQIDQLVETVFEESSGREPASNYLNYTTGSDDYSQKVGWYGEDTDSITIRVITETVSLDPVVFTDKIPINMGTQAGNNRNELFSTGYAANVDLVFKFSNPHGGEGMYNPASGSVIANSAEFRTQGNVVDIDFVIPDATVMDVRN